MMKKSIGCVPVIVSMVLGVLWAGNVMAQSVIQDPARDMFDDSGIFSKSQDTEQDSRAKDPLSLPFDEGNRPEFLKNDKKGEVNSGDHIISPFDGDSGNSRSKQKSDESRPLPPNSAGKDFFGENSGNHDAMDSDDQNDSGKGAGKSKSGADKKPGHDKGNQADFYMDLPFGDDDSETAGEVKGQGKDKSERTVDDPVCRPCKRVTGSPRATCLRKCLGRDPLPEELEDPQVEKKEPKRKHSPNGKSRNARARDPGVFFDF